MHTQQLEMWRRGRVPLSTSEMLLHPHITSHKPEMETQLPNHFHIVYRLGKAP